MAKYIVHKSGNLNVDDPDDSHAMADASVYGYVEVPDGDDALARAKEIAHKALGIKRSFMLSWGQSDDYAKKFALQRGKIGE